MFLGINSFFERLAGAFLYCLVILVFFVILSNCKNNKQLKVSLCFYVLALTFMGFIYKPSVSADVSRLEVFVEEWKSLSFNGFMKTEMVRSSSPLGYLFIYLCGKTEIKGAISGFTSLIFYSCIFYSIYLICSVHKQKDYHNLAITITFYMCSATFISVISGIRAALAFSIIAACYYTELYKKRGFLIHLLFYACACLIHLSAFIIVIVRFIVLLFGNKKISIWFKIILVVSICAGAFFFLKKYSSSSLVKLSFYLYGDSYFSAKLYIYSFIGLFINIFFLFNFFSNEKQRNDMDFEHKLFVISFFTLSLLFISNFVIFARLSIFLNMLMIPIVFSLINSRRLVVSINFKTILTMASFVNLIAAYLGGDLSAYAFIK